MHTYLKAKLWTHFFFDMHCKNVSMRMKCALQYVSRLQCNVQLWLLPPYSTVRAKSGNSSIQSTQITVSVIYTPAPLFSKHFEFSVMHSDLFTICYIFRESICMFIFSAYVDIQLLFSVCMYLHAHITPCM